MSAIRIGWIDFSKEHRNKVISVMHLLTEPGAMDELGVGVVRDVFSNIFFPGTSTIQTRAKYFLIVPFLLYELEHQKVSSADEFISKLHDQETKLIDILKKSGEEGIIGSSAGAELKRKPSDVYWNGISTYHIFNCDRMSIYDYAKVVCTLQTRKQKLKDQGSTNNKDDEIDGDDKDALSGDLLGRFWKLPDIPEHWKDNLSIRLSNQEAIFLKNKIVSSCPESMLSYVLKEEDHDFIAIHEFDHIEGIMDRIPVHLKVHYLLAKQFADFIYGTHLRYNVILSKGESSDILKKWNEWHVGIMDHASIDLNLILPLLGRNGKLFRFLTECKNAMQLDEIKRLDQLVLNREIDLKGKTRSKLYNREDFAYNGWVGISKLQYRLPNAQRLLKDIFDGLGAANV
ncbi:MAG: hypothetical protein CVU50_00760 [Candidatus Cloacimonetes bacterium HGW-Cloacimonetes-3]|jgi:hypothetical protein|nr:MAG: hypothetical protein CVU50_00760 [Candidatus Cloacimonetes bacterium HGW-Cloacimonetes-3]